jgi:Golgi phosphoprotein 3 (GPP34)
VELPQTLHGQRYLLAYDRKRRRFDGDNLWLFGFSLRAAMLTDLYLTGHLKDEGGKAHPTGIAPPPDDPVLRAALIGVTGREWAQLIADKERDAPRIVRDQLEATGWLCVQQRRMLGIIPTARLGVYDEDMVSGLADRVTDSLRRAIDGLPADPRPLAVGLLGVLGQMPTVFSFKESSRHRQQLRTLTFAAIAPIVGLHQAIETYHAHVRVRMCDCE